MSLAVDKIKKWLDDNERTYAWLARQLGTTRQTVQYFMDNNSYVNKKHRAKLKEMFDLQDDWI